MSQAPKSQEKEPAKGFLSAEGPRPRAEPGDEPSSLHFPQVQWLHRLLFAEPLQGSPAPTCIIPPQLLPFSSPRLCPLLPPSTPHQSLSSLWYSPEALYKRKGCGRHLTLHFCKGLCKFNPLQTLTRRPLRPEHPASFRTICSQNNPSLWFDSSLLQHGGGNLCSFA